MRSGDSWVFDSRIGMPWLVVWLSIWRVGCWDEWLNNFYFKIRECCRNNNIYFDYLIIFYTISLFRKFCDALPLVAMQIFINTKSTTRIQMVVFKFFIKNFAFNFVALITCFCDFFFNVNIIYFASFRVSFLFQIFLVLFFLLSVIWQV